MTITEHLEFSVLTAPLASVDRRTLSQAWYSALYAQAAPSSTASRPGAATPVANDEPQVECAEKPSHHALIISDPPRMKAPGPASARTGVPVAERRAVRSPLARKIERVFLRPQNVPRKATFAIDGARGRVRILLHQRGAHVRLVAICPAKAREHVARALAQARYALAVRGIAIEARAQGSLC
ncbi:MAG: hypothetical protein ACXWNK_11345 [Vulcanimicrobiaceae bacterium]